jgi:hypothetical protein
LIVGVVVAALIGVGMTIALVSRDDGGLSPDCKHVDVALRAWGRVVPKIQQTMASDFGAEGFGGPPDPGVLERSAAQAATDVRVQRDLVSSTAIREDVLAIAEGLDLISGSQIGVTAPIAPPNKDFFRGWNQTITAAHDLVVACPGVGDPPVPGLPVRPPS